MQSLRAFTPALASAALLAGTVLSLRRSATRGMPPPDVLKRAVAAARRRARDLG